MERRSFLRSAAAGAALGTVAAPAIAQSQPAIKWRLASSFPKSLDTLYGTAELISRRVSEATGGRFQIQVFQGGEIVPPLQVLDAVQSGTVECCHTAPYYFFGKDPTFALGTSIPFGMNTRQHNAWILHGGGQALLREFMRDYNVINFPAGNTGAQMGGWFRKEIRSAEDLKGLKFRIAGLAGQLLTKLGVVPQQIAGAEIYPSLEKGTIDAAEWVAPYDDEKLGFYKVAKFYYYPGFWEGEAAVEFYVNLKKWEELPAEYRAVLEAACGEANVWMTAKYDAQNPAALKKLLAQGVQLRVFSRDILNACYAAANDLYAEISAKNPKFKKVYDHYRTFRDDEIQWFRVCELNFDNYMASAGQPARGAPSDADRKAAAKKGGKA